MKKESKIAKAKNKAKDKVTAKVAKAGRTAAKAAVAIALAAFAAGCLAPGDMEQPARSQTMSNNFRDCVIVANARQVALDTKAKALDAKTDTMSAPLEMWTQTQANEGSETVTPTATSTPSMTIDTDAALDIPVNKANSGTSAATGSVGALEKIAGAGADWLAGKINGKAAGTATDANAPKTTAADCPGGDCSINAGCADCENGGDCKDCIVGGDCEDCTP